MTDHRFLTLCPECGVNTVEATVTEKGLLSINATPDTDLTSDEIYDLVKKGEGDISICDDCGTDEPTRQRKIKKTFPY